MCFFRHLSGRYYVVTFRAYQYYLFHFLLLSGTTKRLRFKALGLRWFNFWTIYLANVLYAETYESE